MKRLIAAIFMILLVMIVYLNVKLYHTPQVKMIEGQQVNQQLLSELRGLQEALKNGADSRMQRLFPEGSLFFNCLYGLSWSQFAEKLDPQSNLFKAAHLEIQKAVNNVTTESSKDLFIKSLSPSYGSFYAGWTAYLLGKKLALELPDLRSPAETIYFKQQCKDIASALQLNTYPETYPGHAWPADVVLCVAALATHDRIFTPAYTTVIREWLEGVQKNLDSLGMIPHSAETSGPVIQSARGSSMGLMLNFLTDIDQEFAAKQFVLYKKRFLDYRFGLPGIREYPIGITGAGDIDSGPVIFGMGGAATIVGIRAMKTYGENDKATELHQGIEAFALPITIGGKKQFLFGLMPMADAFIAWAHGGGEQNFSESSNNWRLHFQLYSALLALVLSWVFWKLWRRPDPDRKLQHIS